MFLQKVIYIKYVPAELSISTQSSSQHLPILPSWTFHQRFALESDFAYLRANRWHPSVRDVSWLAGSVLGRPWSDGQGQARVRQHSDDC